MWPIVVLAPAAAAATILGIGTVLDWLDESTIRKKQHKIRKVYGKNVKVRQKNTEISAQIADERKRFAAIRWTALQKYYTFQVKLFELYRIYLVETSKEISTITSVMEERIAESVNNETISHSEQLCLFQARLTQLREQAEAFEQHARRLERKQRALAREISSIDQCLAKKSSGAKRRIEELLNKNERTLLKAFRSRQARFAKLDCGKAIFLIDTKCNTCRVYLSDRMSYCYSCGTKQSRVRVRLKFRKKDLVNVYNCRWNCPHCYAPLLPQFGYCYNCGTPHDPFGLRSAMDPKD